LGKAVEIVRQSELVSNQMKNLSVDDNPTNTVADEVKFKRQFKYKSTQNQYDKKNKPPPNNNSKCMRCGKAHSRSYVCPASRAQCNYCKKMGHYKIVCRKFIADKDKNSTRTSHEVNKLLQSRMTIKTCFSVL
jgi:hypothetical protein